MIPLAAFPAINAALNLVTAVLLLLGHDFMRRNLIDRHRRTMLTAFGVSVVFLASYVWYHAHAGVVSYEGAGWQRPLYFAILLTHTVLAAAVPPLAIVTLTRGLKGRIPQHRRIARWTYPIWLYVSFTGVIIYLMLFGSRAR